MKDNKLRIDQILDYCDAPQVFTARDIFDTLYLCLLYDDSDGLQYTGVKISSMMLSRLKNGECDLRSVFLNTEVSGEYYNVKIKGDLAESTTISGFIPEERLPLDGYFIKGYEEEKVTISLPRSDRPLFNSIMRRFGWIAM